ncbi:hypothetical protein H0E84_15360 [Luteimonas sp. SJ-92]|uniref:Uncharacterized protein n=1 Tax=Luteimonas salinisoli TaxID=2752307 RepID=A0A853JEK3_9GAMM|nr:hypothetical protein [Luteimonas salinisoli]NZA27756.1 hypothetical protein [Luteimonas salinisoli]
MSASAELLLAVAVAALYLQDSALLLHYDEAVVTRAGRGWRVAIGPALELGGRQLYLPNPLTPQRVHFRASWLGAEADAGAPDAQRLQPFLAALRAPGAACVALLGLLAALPAALLFYPHALLLAALLFLVYATIGLQLALLARARTTLGLERRELAALAVEALLCPPHAVNLVRRLGLRRGFGGDPVAFAAATLAGPARARLRAAIERRIALIAGHADGSARLQARRRHLQQSLPWA